MKHAWVEPLDAEPLHRRSMIAYKLPDGSVVDIYADTARGADLIDYTLKGGKIVVAVRVGYVL